MPSLWLNSLYCLDLSVSFFCYQSLSLSLSLCCYLLLIKCSIIMTFTVVVVVAVAWDSLALCASIDYSDWRFRNSHTNAFQSQKTIPVFNWNSQRRAALCHRFNTLRSNAAAMLPVSLSPSLSLCLSLPAACQSAQLPLRSCRRALQAIDKYYKRRVEERAHNWARKSASV